MICNKYEIEDRFVMLDISRVRSQACSVVVADIIHTFSSPTYIGGKGFQGRFSLYNWFRRGCAFFVRHLDRRRGFATSFSTGFCSSYSCRLCWEWK